ncbi:acyltransferase [Fulvimarina sp. MAC3]|uniref:acyltransferase n=1 Tax=Fulvimarina sp. MAC3 TaxID=3148887 RepID=UPI0031FDC594
MSGVSSNANRMTWFDANRAWAAIGVVLIHSTTDAAGKAFAAYEPGERIVPTLLRALAELSGSEMFIVFSLFLLASKLDRRRPEYGEAMRDQARRLLVPFAFWAVFYAFFKFVKASAFGYSGAIASQLAEPSSWASYLVLGSSQYHMHFIPTLFALMLFYPVMRVAIRYPMFGLALFPMLGAMEYMQGFVWGYVQDDYLRSYIVRAVKVLGYVGYGFATFAVFSLLRDGIPKGESKLIGRISVFFALFCLAATLPDAFRAAEAGSYQVRQGWGFYAHFLMPLFVFAFFMGRQHAEWSPIWSRAAKYTFGVYLTHPIFIDLYDIALVKSGLSVSPTTMVLTKFAFALASAFAAAKLLSKIPALAWTVGLGPLPFSTRTAPPRALPAARA